MGAEKHSAGVAERQAAHPVKLSTHDVHSPFGRASSIKGIENEWEEDRHTPYSATVTYKGRTICRLEEGRTAETKEQT